MAGKWVRLLGVALLLELAPLGWWWWQVGRIPAISPVRAAELLSLGSEKALLLDVRSRTAFLERRPSGALWFSGQALAHEKPGQLREKWLRKLRHRTLLILGDGGLNSGKIARKLLGWGLRDVRLVEGGFPRWVGTNFGKKAGRLSLESDHGRVELPWRRMPRVEQGALLVAAFALKPLYIALALVLAIWFFRQGSTLSLIVAWGLLCFFVGENVCTVNFLLFAMGSEFLEFVHSSFMVLCFGLVVYGVLEALDEVVGRFSAPKEKCRLGPICCSCAKFTKTSCPAVRLFEVAAVAHLALALIVVGIPIEPLFSWTTLLGEPYFEIHTVPSQLLELRFCPALASGLLFWSWLATRWGGPKAFSRVKPLFAMGTGALYFSLFRLLLYRGFTPRLGWADFWEEATELLFVVGVFVVARIFLPPSTSLAKEGESA